MMVVFEMLGCNGKLNLFPKHRLTVRIGIPDIPINTISIITRKNFPVGNKKTAARPDIKISIATPINMRR